MKGGIPRNLISYINVLRLLFRIKNYIKLFHWPGMLPL